MKKTYNIELPSGEEVVVDYNSRAFSEESVCPHLEFHGLATSETGYRSHFFGGAIGSKEPNFEEVEVYIKHLIEEWTGVKFDAQVQRKLLF